MQAIYWVGLFFNNFLPGNVGGDLVKVSDVAVNTGNVARTVAGTLLDRMLGLCALVFVAFAAGAILVVSGLSPRGLGSYFAAADGDQGLGRVAALLGSVSRQPLGERGNGSRVF